MKTSIKCSECKKMVSKYRDTGLARIFMCKCGMNTVVKKK